MRSECPSRSSRLPVACAQPAGSPQNLLGPSALAVISQVTSTEVPAGEAKTIQPRFADFPQTAQWALGGLSAWPQSPGDGFPGWTVGGR